MPGNTFKTLKVFSIVLCLQCPYSIEGLKLKKVAENAIDIIESSIDFIKEIITENNSENSKEQLHNRLDNLHRKLEFTNEKVDELFDVIKQQS